MIIEELCGEKLWDNETIYSQNPDFTNCFENTVLIWLPCLILWIISPIWIYMLTKHNQPKINLSFIIITKIVSFEFYRTKSFFFKKYLKTYFLFY